MCYFDMHSQLFCTTLIRKLKIVKKKRYTLLCVEVENELRKANECLNANRLSLNVDKSSFMLFTHSRVHRNSISIRLGK